MVSIKNNGVQLRTIIQPPTPDPNRSILFSDGVRLQITGAISGSLSTVQDINNLQTQITNNANGLNNYALTTTVAAISAGLQTQNNNDRVNYTLNSTTALISAGLQTQITNNFNKFNDYTLMSTTSAISSGLTNRIGSVEANYTLKTITSAISAGLQTQITNNYNALNNYALTTTVTAISGGDFSFNGVKIGQGGSGYVSNTIVGKDALFNNTTGYNSVAIGYESLKTNNSGHSNVAVGYQALVANTIGTSNIAIGTTLLSNNLDGSDNIAIGDSSLNANVSGVENIGIGTQSLFYCTGSHNVALGTYTGFSPVEITTGSYNTMIGSEAGVDSLTSSYRTSLGAQATCLNDNTIRCGRASTDTLRGYNYTADSDRRLKENIVDLPIGLDFVMTLRPVSYKWKDRTFENGNKVTYSRNHCGFIAQEIGDALKATGKDFGIYQDSGVAKGITEELPVDMNHYKDPADLKGYSVEQMLAVAVKAIQELKLKNDALEARIAALEK